MMAVKARFMLFASVLATASTVLTGIAHSQTGIASVYSGGGGLTAAHRSLPFGTLVRVTHNRTHRSVVVRINDRGPFVGGRIIDLTPAAARAIGFSGLASVTVTVVGHS